MGRVWDELIIRVYDKKEEERKRLLQNEGESLKNLTQELGLPPLEDCEE